MNTQETIDLLYKLKLKGLSDAYKAITLMPVSERPDMDLAIAKIAEAEQLYRDNQKTQMYLKTSKLRYNANLEDIECSETRNLPKSKLQELSDCSFVRRAENLLITLRKLSNEELRISVFLIVNDHLQLSCFRLKFHKKTLACGVSCE